LWDFFLLFFSQGLVGAMWARDRNKGAQILATGKRAMGSTTRELNALLQRHGLFPDKHSLNLLKEHIDESADRKADLTNIVQRIKNNPSRTRPTHLSAAGLPLPAHAYNACFLLILRHCGVNMHAVVSISGYDV